MDRDVAWNQIKSITSLLISVSLSFSYLSHTILNSLVTYSPLSYLHTYTVVDRDVAWNQIKSISGFGSGGSKTNSLFWVASRNPPPSNYNSSVHAVDVRASVKASCSSNSACDASGAIGYCCPTEGVGLTPGVSLGCCPTLKS